MPLDNFESKIKFFIERERLASPGARIGVALSGGADSVALLAALSRIGFETVALHCNFHLRGDESNRDQRHAEAVAKRFACEFVAVDFDVRTRQLADGSSLEMACRDLRYEWFERMAKELRLDVVAVGHHLADRVETFMLNLLRGSGLRGLSSPHPRRGIFIRPMLECSRREILDYLRRIDVGYVDDSSNASSDFKRNRLRNDVLPHLTGNFPDAFRRIGNTIDNLDRQRRLFDDMVRQKAEAYFNADQTALDLQSLMANEKEPTELLFEILRDRGVNHSMAEDIVVSHGESGRRFGPWMLNRGQLLLSPEASPGSDAFDFERTVAVEIVDRTAFCPSRDANVAWFDAEVLSGSASIAMKPWSRGDRMRPFGMKGSRLVSDIFAEARLSAAEKETQPIVWRGDEIIWIPGLKCSALYTVTPTTTRIAKFTYRPER